MPPDAEDLITTATSMACEVTVRARPGPAVTPDETRAAMVDALDVVRAVDTTCTRFTPDSDLMRANARGGDWVTVSEHCFAAVVEAYGAYRRTNARFDPRVLTDLIRLGYAESYRRRLPAPRDAAEALAARPPLPEWRPEFRSRTTQVRVGPHPIDLGGIGKGLAVRWASARLRVARVRDHLVSAGGDCYCAGSPADTRFWRVSVEDPHGGPDPVAVIDASDEAVTTSSVRVRSWRVEDQDVHHLIDPRTGRPGGDGLASVTVVDADPADGEVWSKVLFLAGRRGVRATARLHGVPALWVGTDGEVEWTDTMTPRLAWTACR